jgi:hypothetical protein
VEGYVEGVGDHAKICGLLAHWKVPKVTSMACKPDYSSPQTQEKVENGLSVMKDMLIGFKSL